MQQIENGDNPDISVVIPCYNEEPGLPELLTRVSDACLGVAPLSYEIVMVNDGSRDRSWPIIAEFAAADEHIVGVNLSRNYGHQIALSAGLEICRGDMVMVMDADLQDPPELLPNLLAKMGEGFDVVYGQRISRAGETVFKRASASLFYRFLQHMVDVDMPPNTGDFRIMSRRVVDHLNAMPERFRFVRGMISWIGFNQAPLPYERDARFAGESHYPLAKMIGFAIDAVTSFSTLPLRFAVHLGLIVGLIGGLMLGWVGLSWLAGNTLAGWASLAATVLLLGSIQLVMLGVFGEYLGRMYLESKQRPKFFIADICMKNRSKNSTNPVHHFHQRIQRAVNG